MDCPPKSTTQPQIGIINITYILLQDPGEMDHGESYHEESHQLTQDHKEEQEKEHMIKKKT